MKITQKTIPSWLALKKPEVYKEMVEDFDNLNKAAEIGDPFSPKKKVKLDEVIDFLYVQEEASLSEITAHVYGIGDRDTAWPIAKRNMNSRLESKNAKNHVHGIFERVTGKKAVWKLTAARRAAIEGQGAGIKKTLETKIEATATVVK